MCPSKTTQFYQANTLRYRPGGFKVPRQIVPFVVACDYWGLFFFFFYTSVIGICAGPLEQQWKIKCENKVKVHQIFIVTGRKNEKKINEGCWKWFESQVTIIYVMPNVPNLLFQRG